MQPDVADHRVQPATVPLLAYGFRPFFLLAGLWAVVPMLTVAASLWLGGWPGGSLPLLTWHGHELLFGFAGAAIAGFLLTAVPSWTGTRAVSGYPLAALVAAWVCARLVSAPFGRADHWIEQLAGIAFLPLLAVTVAVPLLRSRNFRNLPFILLLALLFLAELLFQLPRFGWSEPAPLDALRLALNTILLMVGIVGGRILPAFTRNAFAALGRPIAITSTPWLDRASLAALVAVLGGDLVTQDTQLAGAVAAVAAMLLGWRARHWGSWHTRETPLLWVLHLGYAWLIAGLALKAAWLLGSFGWAAHWMHAITVGCFGTMILGVSTRAALGHTGRPLRAARPIVASYLLVSLAALLRIAGPHLLPDYRMAVTLAILCWSSAYMIFLAVYLPILLQPRVDGRPG